MTNYVGWGISLTASTGGLPVMPARMSNDAFDAFGVNTHFNYATPPLDQQTHYYYDATVDYILSMGVGHVRQRGSLVNPGRDATRAAVQRLMNEGNVKFCSTLLIWNQVPDLATARTYVNNYLDEYQNNGFNVNLLDAFAGPNEPNGAIETMDPNWAQRVRYAMQATYEETRKRSYFDGVAIQGPPLQKPVGSRVAGSDSLTVLAQDVAAIGTISQWADRADAHIYPGDNDILGTSFATDILNIVKDMYPNNEQFTVTEGGYFNATPDDHGYVYQNGGAQPIPETVHAKYAPKWPLSHLLLGNSCFYAYEMLNKQPPFNVNTPDDAGGVHEATFGYIYTPQLDPSTWSPKPQFYAMQNYLALFKDPGNTFTTNGLPISITGGGSDLQKILFQKRNGKYYLAVWRSVNLYDWNRQANGGLGAGTYLSVTAQTITFTMNTTRPVSVYKPSVQAAAVQTLNAATFTQSISDQLHVLEIG